MLKTKFVIINGIKIPTASQFNDKPKFEKRRRNSYSKKHNQRNSEVVINAKKFFRLIKEVSYFIKNKF